MQKTIALIEDEPALRNNYEAALKRNGYQVVALSDRPSAEHYFDNLLPDLAIIDIGLGDDIDGGFALCQKLRAKSSSVPIVFLTARDNDLDTISGLRMGADDYLSKDISLPHLLARISALFRRTESLKLPQNSKDIFELGPLKMDTNRMITSWKSQKVELTVTEFWMLYSIVKHEGHVKSRQQLMDESKMVVDDTTITSHIKRIRKKFVQLDSEFGCIDTVYGMGYRWKSSE